MTRTARALTIVGALLLTSVSATASATTSRQHFTVVGIGEEDQLEHPRVVAAGVLNGVGTDVVLGDEEDPETGTLTLRDQFVFPEGSLFVTATGPIHYSFDARTCVRINTFSGKYQITGGTGAYEGATGHGTYFGRMIFVERGPAGCLDEGGHGSIVIRYVGDLALASERAA